MRQLTTDELYYADQGSEEIELSVGRCLLAPTALAAKPRKDRDFRVAARRRFAGNRQRISDALCSDPFIKKMVDGDVRDRNIIIATIIDIFGTTFVGFVPVAADATMIFNYRIEKICKKHNGTDLDG